MGNVLKYAAAGVVGYAVHAVVTKKAESKVYKPHTIEDPTLAGTLSEYLVTKISKKISRVLYDETPKNPSGTQYHRGR